MVDDATVNKAGAHIGLDVREGMNAGMERSKFVHGFPEVSYHLLEEPAYGRRFRAALDADYSAVLDDNLYGISEERRYSDIP